MSKLKQLFCRHTSQIVIYRNDRPLKNLKNIETYNVSVCENCKKRILNIEHQNKFKIIRNRKI